MTGFDLWFHGRERMKTVFVVGVVMSVCLSGCMCPGYVHDARLWNMRFNIDPPLTGVRIMPPQEGEDDQYGSPGELTIAADSTP